MCGTDNDCGCGCSESSAPDPVRRDFLKTIGGLALGGLGAGAAITPIEAYAAKASLLGSINSGMGNCFDHEIIGICTCKFPPVPCGFRVRHYLPVAMIECITSPEDSVIIGSSTAGLSGTRRLTTSGTDRQTGFDVNVWTINDYVRSAMTYGFSNCGWCDSGDARGGGGSVSGPTGGGILDAADNLIGCGLGLGSVISGINSLGDFSAAGISLPLAYSSGIDQEHWSTGCRDRFEATVRSPLVPPMCSVSLPEGVSSALKERAGQLGDYLPGSISRSDVCIGSMGPLYPRQMNAQGKTDPIGALVTAWRALHLARFDLGTFNYRVDTDDNKWQMLYPGVGSSCFRLSDSVESLENKVGVSDDGRYAFIYWTPVTCCIDFAEYGCTAATG